MFIFGLMSGLAPIPLRHRMSDPCSRLSGLLAAKAKKGVFFYQGDTV